MTEVDTLIRRLVDRYEPDRVILFGSKARGDAVPGGDIDLVVVKRTDRRFLDRIAEALLSMEPDRAVDILVYTPEEFKKMQEEGNPFVERILARERRSMFDPRAESRRWMAQAERDMQAALYTRQGGFHETACFLYGTIERVEEGMPPDLCFLL